MRPGYLLDTSIVSLFAPERFGVPPELAIWMRSNEMRLHVSSVTLFEITQGIGKMLRSGRAERAAGLMGWRDALAETFGKRLLPVDEMVANAAGLLSDEAFARGRHPGFLDVLIAGTAKAHGIAVLTGNVRHFEPLGVPVRDPMTGVPD